MNSLKKELLRKAFHFLLITHAPTFHTKILIKLSTTLCLEKLSSNYNFEENVSSAPSTANRKTTAESLQFIETKNRENFLSIKNKKRFYYQYYFDKTFLSEN